MRSGWLPLISRLYYQHSGNLFQHSPYPLHWIFMYSSSTRCCPIRATTPSSGPLGFVLRHLQHRSQHHLCLWLLCGRHHSVLAQVKQLDGNLCLFSPGDLCHHICREFRGTACTTLEFAFQIRCLSRCCQYCRFLLPVSNWTVCPTLDPLALNRSNPLLGFQRLVAPCPNESRREHHLYEHRLSWVCGNTDPYHQQ